MTTQTTFTRLNENDSLIKSSRQVDQFIDREPFIQKRIRELANGTLAVKTVQPK